MVNSNREIHAISLIAFYNETKNETSTIMVFNCHNDGGDYFFMEKESIENSSTFDIEINPENPNLRLSKEEFIFMFNQFDCYINCEFNGLSKRDPDCFDDWGTSWWEKFTGWCGRIFGGGGSSGGIFVPGWDIGGPWDIWGTGSTSIPPNVLSGGYNGPLNPTFQDAIWLLQMDCEDEILDSAGIGIENGLIEDDVVNPTALAIHEQWCYFKNRCMADDFSGHQPLSPPVLYNSTYWENPYYQIGQFFSENVGLFQEIINMDYGCVSLDDLELVKCINDFEERYDLDLTRAERKEIEGIVDCGGSGGDEEAIETLIELKYKTEIKNVKVVNNVLMGVDNEGFIKIYHVKSKDPDNLTGQELFDHIIEVVHCTVLYFCETDEYKNIDWRDYLHDIGKSAYVYGGPNNIYFDNCQAGMLLDFSWGGYISESVGNYDGQTDDGNATLIQYRFENVGVGLNRPVLHLSVGYNCDPTFVNYIKDPC